MNRRNFNTVKKGKPNKITHYGVRRNGDIYIKTATEFEVPFLFKQWGEWTPGCRAALTNSSLRMLEQSGSWKILPPDGRVMQRVGKHKAGRMLDDKYHDGVPPA